MDVLKWFTSAVEGTLKDGVETLSRAFSDKARILADYSLSRTFRTEVDSLRSDLRTEIATLRRNSLEVVQTVLQEVNEQKKHLREER